MTDVNLKITILTLDLSKIIMRRIQEFTGLNMAKDIVVLYLNSNS